MLKFGVLPHKSDIFDKSCVDNKELKNVLPQNCLNFLTYEAKPNNSKLKHFSKISFFNFMVKWSNSRIKVGENRVQTAIVAIYKNAAICFSIEVKPQNLPLTFRERISERK